MAQKEKLEGKILNLVKNDSRATTLTILAKLRKRNPNLLESEVRQAIWRLIDRGWLALKDYSLILILTEKGRKKE